MTTRAATLAGTPCWADLWTSDVEGSRRFYGELFGWKPLDPDPDYGGYFNFARQGAPIAGCMGDMGDMRADDTWKPYLATKDMTSTLEAAKAAGAQVAVPAMPVGDLGVQGVIVDPTGATLGLWQAGSWPGFGVVEEHGAPSWFELHTGDYAGALAFYRRVFGLDASAVSDSDEFRYSTLRRPGEEADLAGVCDDSSVLRDDEAAHWAIYWQVDDVDASVAKLRSLGGTVHSGPDSTPYGRIAVVADPGGAKFMLHGRDA
ncbi:MAG: VOC family protein [Acidimicrobiales bacterium]